MRLCFAYGSNMDPEGMASRCPGARAIGPAVLRGHRFLIAASGWATVRPDNMSDVYGLLLELSTADEEALDRWEEVATGLYRKISMPVTLLRGERVDALVYVETSAEGEGAPDASYIDCIVAAAERLDLPPDYVHELRRWA